MELWALLIMVVGSGGVVASAVLEIRTREPVYALMMKIFPWVFGIGAILFTIAR